MDWDLEGGDVEVLEGVEGPGFDVDGGLLVGGRDGGVDCHGCESGGVDRPQGVVNEGFGGLDAIDSMATMDFALMDLREG